MHCLGSNFEFSTSEYLTFRNINVGQIKTGTFEVHMRESVIQF
jgi:hypothetical protein